MNIISVSIFIIVSLFILNKVIDYFSKSTYLIQEIVDATKPITIDSGKLNSYGSNNAVNYAYSVWIYVNDWVYRYGEEKIIFARGIKDKTGSTINDPSPLLSLGSIENNLIIRTSYLSDDNKLYLSENKINHIPLQKWVNIIVSVYGRTADMYLDGKLVNSFVLPGISNINSKEDLYITPYGGFSGNLTRLQYLGNAVNPQQAWNIYKDGVGDNFGPFSTNINITFSTNGEPSRNLF